jgi:hypothetical protein
MNAVTISVTLPAHANREVVEAWGGQVRQMSLASFEAEPAMTVAFHAARAFPGFVIQGRFYASVRQGFPSEGSVDADVSRHAAGLAHWGSGSPSFARLLAMETNTIVVNGIPCEQVQEPFWNVSVDNSHRGDRPSQIRCNLSLHREFPRDIPPSESPRIAFPANRKADVDACMARLHELHPRSTLFPSGHCCEILRPDVLRGDTLAMSVSAVSRALVESTHRALPVLPRAAVEAWMGLRRLAAVNDPVAFARAAAAFSALLHLPPANVDPEALKWKRRAHVQADMLALRLAAEPDLAQVDELDLLAPNGP